MKLALQRLLLDPPPPGIEEKLKELGYTALVFVDGLNE
jgi:hypothetical protein